MAKFSKNNFKLIVREIEKMQAANENIDIPIGILEVMYDDYWGYIDDFFHLEDKITDYDIDDLFETICDLSPHCSC